MSAKCSLGCAVLLSFAVPVPAAVIGTNVPAVPLTKERVAALPPAEQRPWQEYLARSARQSQTDHAFLLKEMKQHGLAKSMAVVPPGRGGGLPLGNNTDWYRQPEAARIADIVVSFQTPAGGWSKNLDMTRSPRASGQPFTTDNGSHFLSADDNDTPHNASWSYVGTFDNNTTTTQMRYLARVITARNGKGFGAWRKSFLRGLDYIFASQYPNGGWPQVWPLEGGYHDGITYNDDAMVHVLQLLRDVADGQGDFTFVPARARAKAAASLQRGIGCLLATQIAMNGRRTVWCQQYDPLTLQPAAARNYEMPSEASSESANLTLFLMQLPRPDSNMVSAVTAAVAWFEKTGIHDMAFQWDDQGGRRLVARPGSGPLWARYYGIGSDHPIFGDRDQSIHDDVNEISPERRAGYAWFGASPERVLALYPAWRKTHPD